MSRLVTVAALVLPMAGWAPFDLQQPFVLGPCFLVRLGVSFVDIALAQIGDRDGAALLRLPFGNRVDAIGHLPGDVERLGPRRLFRG